MIGLNVCVLFSMNHVQHHLGSVRHKQYNKNSKILSEQTASLNTSSSICQYIVLKLYYCIVISLKLLRFYVLLFNAHNGVLFQNDVYKQCITFIEIYAALGFIIGTKKDKMITYRAPCYKFMVKCCHNKKLLDWLLHNHFIYLCSFRYEFIPFFGPGFWPFSPNKAFLESLRDFTNPKKSPKFVNNLLIFCFPNQEENSQGC